MGLLGWDAAKLASEAGLVRMTVSRYLNGGPDNCAPKLISAFSAHGITFTDGRTKRTITQAKSRKGE